jgi:hypothetical protein
MPLGFLSRSPFEPVTRLSTTVQWVLVVVQVLVLVALVVLAAMHMSGFESGLTNVWDAKYLDGGNVKFRSSSVRDDPGNSSTSPVVKQRFEGFSQMTSSAVWPPSEMLGRREAVMDNIPMVLPELGPDNVDGLNDPLRKELY